MCHQRVDHLGHVVHQPPVARRQRAEGGPGVAHAGQARQVLVQVAVRWADHHGRAVHDVVAGQQEALLLHEPTQMVRGMAGGVERPQRQIPRGRGARAGKGPPLPDALVGREVLGGPEADDPGSRGRGQRGRTRRVVDMGVGDEDGADRAQRGGGRHDGGRVGRIGRAGVDDDRLGAVPRGRCSSPVPS